MLFNSLAFLIFFPIITTAYFLLPGRWRWALLLVAGCYFYMSFVPAYIFILLFTITVDYFAGIWIESAEGRRRKGFLLLSILANLGVLAAFKYFNFFNANLAWLASAIGWNYPIQSLAFVLPIGLSFHTFQSLSYTIEVYRRHYKAERHFGILALYVMFYPQLVAGPIERPQNLLPKLKTVHAFEYQRVVDGLIRMAWGLFKKAVVADNLALIANRVFGHPHSYTGPALILGTLSFAVQIYCDFSGYSDIALGAAQVMGIRLMENFKRPYFATTLTDFWHCWHISLSSWFRDYLYIPLGGGRVPWLRWAANLMVVFLLSGLWHGAAWTFVAWGALHGLALVVSHWQGWSVLSRITRLEKVPRLRAFLGWASTFSLVTFAWIFFRAETFSEAGYIAGHLASGVKSYLAFAWHNLPSLGFRATLLDPLGLELTMRHVFILSIGLGVLIAVEVLQGRSGWLPKLETKPAVLRWAVYVLLVMGLLLFSATQPHQFIYFQF